MKRCPPLFTRAAWAALLVALVAVSAFGQASLATGNIFGKVLDSSGAGLPGVTVTLTGGGAPQTVVTDADGDFRFISLSPGTYSVKAELAGMGTATRSGVTVNIGRNADISLTLNPSVSQTITVTAEAPLLDTRRTGTGATVTEVELEEVPSARDPWVILQQVPGVLMDRINVGGNESGQQSGFVSKGITSAQATYSVDGVNTTDMIATGGSSAYYDFGAFEEIQVATGGTDPRVQTPGAQINIVTKRGTNDFSGSARYYLTDGGTQGERKIPSEATSYINRTNEINEVTEWGGEAGGPIIRDRLWLWAAYADQQIDLFTAQPPGATVRYADNTTLETLNAKLNAQITRNNSATFFYTDNQKVKTGRNASPNRPPETTWNQGGFGPKGTYKIEDTHIFNSNLYLTGMYSKVNGGFYLAADSGLGCKDIDCILSVPTGIVRDFTGGPNTGQYRNTWFSPFGERPQDQLRLDGSAFFNTGALSHELKFGFGYRTAGTTGISLWPQNQYILDFGDGFGLTYFLASGSYDYEYEYQDIYVGDTMLWGNLTLQAGLRFDTQTASAGDHVGPSNPLVTDPATGIAWLPQQSISAGEIDQMEWEDISPRIGLTYALGAEKRTLLRAAYNRYVDQMGSNTTSYSDVIPAFYRYVSFYTLDANHNDRIDAGEVLFDYTDHFPYFWKGLDPDNPGSVLSTVRVDPNMNAPNTDEFILGFEHELFRDFVVGINYTHREMNDFVVERTEKTRGAGDYITSADYELLKTVTRPAGVTEVDPYSIPVYALKAGISPVWSVLTNLPDYSQQYDGIDLSLIKRMSNRWMFRGNISFNDWTQNVGPEAVVDPTNIRTGLGCSNCDGADVVSGSGTISGARGAVWVNSEWAVNATGIYQIPFIEANLGANFTMRQGYPVLYSHSTASRAPEGTKILLVSDVTEHRLPNPYSLDLRLSKDFRFRGVGVELALDAFNITNEQTVLQRNADLVVVSGGADTLSGSRNRIRELQNPRVLRYGIRFTF
jgi:Carboxypeptidase regulatory-like domain/TonB-dependent Receptor Plug Domain